MGKIKYSEFEAHLQAGNPYTGLVEGIGYVYWKQETVFFRKVYREEIQGGGYIDYIQPPVRKFGFMGKSIFFQVENIVVANNYKMKGYEIISKTQYEIQIITPDELYDIGIRGNLKYWQQCLEYYDGNLPIKNKEYVAENDAIPAIKKGKEIEMIRGKPSSKVLTNDPAVIAISEAGRTVGNAVGPFLEIAENFSSLKALPYVGKALDGLSIISDINDGEYYSAAGNLIIACAGIYGAIAEIGVMIYESESFILQNYHSSKREYISRKAQYERNSSNWNRRNMDNALRALSKAEERYRNLMKKKYGTYWD